MSGKSRSVKPISSLGSIQFDRPRVPQSFVATDQPAEMMLVEVSTRTALSTDDSLLTETDTEHPAKCQGQHFHVEIVLYAGAVGPPWREPTTIGAEVLPLIRRPERAVRIPLPYPHDHQERTWRKFGRGVAEWPGSDPTMGVVAPCLGACAVAEAVPTG